MHPNDFAKDHFSHLHCLLAWLPLLPSCLNGLLCATVDFLTSSALGPNPAGSEGHYIEVILPFLLHVPLKGHFSFLLHPHRFVYCPLLSVCCWHPPYDGGGREGLCIATILSRPTALAPMMVILSKEFNSFTAGLPSSFVLVEVGDGLQSHRDILLQPLLAHL